MARKYVLIAKTSQIAEAFAELNGIKSSEYLYPGRAVRLEGIHDLTAIFIEGWRERKDHFKIIQAVNSAEINNVKLMDAKPDQVLTLETTAT